MSLPAYLDAVDDQVAMAYAEQSQSLQSRREKSWAVCEIIRRLAKQIPSAAVVRHFTGCGSVTDIQRDIRAFQEQALALPQRLELPEVPEPLVEGFEGLLDKVWGLAVTQATDRFNERRIELEAANQVAIEQADRVAAQRDLALDHIKAVEADLRVAQETAKGLEARLVGKDSELAAQQDAIAGRDREISRLELRLAEQIQEVAAANERADGATRRALIDIDEARQETRAAIEKAKRFEVELEQNKVLERQHKIRAATLEDKVVQLTKDIDKLRRPALAKRIHRSPARPSRAKQIRR